MRTQPPANLVSLLARLKLATAEQIAGVARRAGRLAGDLCEFESVWVDALAQARILTPFQAAEINAGRGESLLHGPYVVTHALGGPHWADCYAARHVETGRAVRLYVVRRPQGPTAANVQALAQLVAQSPPLRSPVSSMVEDFGTSGELVWTACAAVEGTPAADWMVENGRFPAPAVLHIAREMVQRLADLELLGIVHGDVGAAGLLAQESGHVVLPAPGLRGIVRPHEGYSFNDLRPEAYDYLAPERIADGAPPTFAGDVYACGCLWWHLLTGRAPFAGGDSLAKLKAVHAARTVNVRQLAPDVPEVLAQTIESCLARQRDVRPQSLAKLCERLGAPTRAGSSMLAGLLGRPMPSWQLVRHRNHRKRRANRKAQWAAGIATVCVLLLLVALSPLLFFSRRQPAQTASTHRTPPAGAAKLPDDTSAMARTSNMPGANNSVDQRVDPAVQQAAATLPSGSRLNDDVVLPAEEVLRIEQLDLEPHVRVRGRAGRRPRVSVPRRGLVVACEDVTFEGIDFVWEDERRGQRAAPVSAGAMIVVGAQTARFHGCSFSTTADAAPVAIAWTGAADGLPGLGGEITLRDCASDGVAALVDCQGAGGLSVTVDNSLCVSSGPLVRLHRAPQADETFALVLDHVTTRGDSAVLECRYRRLHENPGAITITANQSALAGNPIWGLVIFSGPERPDRLVASLTWTGQGSIVTPQTAMVVWRGAGRKQQALPEEDLQVAGLVRSELEFAGPADGLPAASRVTRWQVPLRSADPPGANTDTLSLPRR